MHTTGLPSAAFKHTYYRVTVTPHGGGVYIDLSVAELDCVQFFRLSEMESFRIHNTEIVCCDISQLFYNYN